MTPSKEAIEAAAWNFLEEWQKYSEVDRSSVCPPVNIKEILEAAYSIDAAPLEKRFEIASELAASRGMENDELKERIAELEAENQRLKAQVVRLIRENSLIEEQLAHFKDCYASLASLYDKAQLEGK